MIISIISIKCNGRKILKLYNQILIENYFVRFLIKSIKTEYFATLKLLVISKLFSNEEKYPI